MKPLAPLVEGSERSIVSATVANTLIGGANAIRGFRGGNGIHVTQAAANIRVDLANGITLEDIHFGSCPLFADYSVNESFAYHKTAANYNTCPPVAGHHIDYTTNTSSASARAHQTWNLSTYFPYQVFHDGLCPIAGSASGIGNRGGSIDFAGYPQVGKVNGGTFKLRLTAVSHNGGDIISNELTANIPWNATNQQVEDAINATAVGAHVGGVTVAGFTPTFPTYPAQYWEYAIGASSSGWDYSYADGLTHGTGASYEDWIYITPGFSSGAWTSGLIPTSTSAPTLVQQFAELKQLSGSIFTGHKIHHKANAWRDLASGAFTIGPFAQKMVLYYVTDVKFDDGLYYSVNGAAPEYKFGDAYGKTAGLPERVIQAGQTLRVRCMDSGGAYIWASGILGVNPPHCCSNAMRAILGI